MKVNIIHLSHRIDRMELLKKELLTQGITDYQLWDGFTDEKTPRQNIAKAHKQIIQDAKERGLREVCIAEDDFHFPAQDGFDYFIKQQPYDFDIYLSGIYLGLDKKTPSDFRYNGLHFYIVHHRFFDAFLNLDITNQDLDSAISQQARLLKCKVVIVFPYAAIQHETKSDNSGCIFDWKYFFNNGNVYGFLNGTNNNIE